MGVNLVVYVVDLEVAGREGRPSRKGACKEEVVWCKCATRRLEMPGEKRLESLGDEWMQNVSRRRRSMQRETGRWDAIPRGRISQSQKQCLDRE